ncbi:alpha-keto acid decarboxylase family protein [Streptomyces sp. NPDC055966]|uniref:alpha-keto acid decarboxylase family protein n=1 Tax=Streptomyces sp. NPDC055966 TaxID=3345669 RepID=UPI0035E195CB
MPSSQTKRMTIGDFLLRRMAEAGIGHVFGVPGDYNLELLQQMHDGGAMEWVGNCNELNASYAADGYARLKGMGAFLVTNAVGAMSAINGVAGCYAEHVPVVAVCGSIPLRSIERNLGMHHTMADGTWDRFLSAFSQVTAAQVRLTPRNAAMEIDRLISTAWREKLPVYMEVPSDIAYLEIEVPTEPLVLEQPPSDPERLRSCVATVASFLSGAKSAAMLVDLDVDRFGVAAEVTELAEKLRLPIAACSTAKAVINETLPNYVGIYNGRASAPETIEAVEGSERLLTIGYRPIEVTTGDFSAKLPAESIHLRSHSADVGVANFQAVNLKDVLRGVIDAVSPVAERTIRKPAAPKPHAADGSAKLTQTAYWKAVQEYVKPGDVLLVDNGTSYALFGVELPESCTFVGSVNWGSIGFSVGALLGTLTAAPQRRHLLFVGDGSFQEAAQELSTIMRHDHKPVVLLINNGGYTIERGYLGRDERYNDIAAWAYAELPKVLCPDTTARSFVVKTPDDLRKAMSAPNDKMIFIESVMDPHDIPAPIAASSNHGADVDYGPRGPHHRDGAQLL